MILKFVRGTESFSAGGYSGLRVMSGTHRAVQTYPMKG
jgi:hypothetical protein